ncbi:hypothetical protein EB796_025008 [Bugula neritina]|uniref:Uncharacterized protein n=1 Tax=Bugula neritina TaxID=10212 RepID=A0A7J7ISY5_BUGNE|nr:hypothetical protein EB796_025008 [Bugula neritina]
MEATTYLHSKPIYLFGERLSSFSGRFYCTHVMFSVWLAFDGIILACTVLSFILTITLLVYNCIAACTCCYSCCGSCCICCDGTTMDSNRMAVSYCTQPPIHSVPTQL